MFETLFSSSPLLIGLYVFGLGAIIGSFLNVVIYRFHTGKSLSGSSHCLSCQRPLRWYDLVPVISYCWLRGRCRACGCTFSPRYLIVEVLTAVLFVLALGQAASLLELLLLWGVFSVLMVIFVYDIRHFIIPDTLTALTLFFVVALTAPQTLDRLSLQQYGVELVAAALGSLFLFVLWFVSKGQWLGFGDVKLAFPLGLLVGSDHVFSFIVMSFWVGAGISLILVGLAKLERGKLGLRFLPGGITIKSVVPFAPFLIMGALLVFLTNINVLSLFTL